MVSIHKRGKDRGHTGCYRPVSLANCVGKLVAKNDQYSPGVASGVEQHHHSRADSFAAAPFHRGPGDLHSQKNEDGF